MTTPAKGSWWVEAELRLDTRSRYKLHLIRCGFGWTVWSPLPFRHDQPSLTRPWGFVYFNQFQDAIDALPGLWARAKLGELGEEPRHG